MLFEAPKVTDHTEMIVLRNSASSILCEPRLGVVLRVRGGILRRNNSTDRRRDASPNEEKIQKSDDNYWQ
jgi:hypothetical protein